MTDVLSAAQGLFAAVECLNSTARDRIVRTWLLACSDADAAEWRRLVEADRQRRYREAKAQLKTAVTPEPAETNVTKAVTLGQQETSVTDSGLSRWATGKPAGQVLAAAKPLPPPSPAPSPGPPSPPAPTPTHVRSAGARGDFFTDQPKSDRLPDGSRKSRPDNLGQVVARCAELHLPASDAEAIWCKWEGNGFTNDRKPMKNWHQVIRAWQLHGYLPSQKAFRNQTPQTNGTHQRYPAHGGTPLRGATDRNAGGANANGTSDYSRVGKVQPGAVPDAV